MGKAHPDAGFSLIETLVALAVLATGAMVLLTAADRHVVQTGNLADAVMARWIAEDALTLARLGRSPQEAGDGMSLPGRDWTVRDEWRPLGNSAAGLVALTVSVGSAREISAATMTGYVIERTGQ